MPALRSLTLLRAPQPTNQIVGSLHHPDTHLQLRGTLLVRRQRLPGRRQLSLLPRQPLVQLKHGVVGLLHSEGEEQRWQGEG